jgi:AcrR family transcriptional regulator
MPKSSQLEDIAGRAERKRAVNSHKRHIILDAAGRVFAAHGLEGASLRAIAKEAGYTPGALYFHYASKEEIYGDLLAESLDRLDAAVDAAVASGADAHTRLAAMWFAFFDYYRTNPEDLALGFYLFKGMRPLGLTAELNARLNAKLRAVLGRIKKQMREIGADPDAAERETAALFAHSTGLLLLVHTGRIKLFPFEARDLLQDAIDRLIERLPPVRRPSSTPV